MVLWLDCWPKNGFKFPLTHVTHQVTLGQSRSLSLSLICLKRFGEKKRGLVSTMQSTLNSWEQGQDINTIKVINLWANTNLIKLLVSKSSHGLHLLSFLHPTPPQYLLFFYKMRFLKLQFSTENFLGKQKNSHLILYITNSCSHTATLPTHYPATFPFMGQKMQVLTVSLPFRAIFNKVGWKAVIWEEIFLEKFSSVHIVEKNIVFLKKIQNFQ